MVSSNIAVCSTVFSYCHNCSIAQGNRTKRSFNSGAPARRRRANTAPFFRKFRKTVKSRKFGYDVTVRASERTPSVETLGEGAGRLTREFKQITTAGATTAAVNEKVWREYVSVVCQILIETSAKELKSLFSLVSHSQMTSLKGRWPLFAFPGRTDYF